MTEAPEFSAVDTAYRHLRVAILSGSARPGERILEADVAAKTKTSRTPVREALRRLGAEGLVEVIANKGARVASLNAQDLTEIFDLRVLVEPYTAACAARGASLAQLDGMKAVSSQMRCEVRDQASIGAVD